MYGSGISKEGSILDTGVNTEIINKSGSWYSYGEHKLGQGRENAKDFLRENPEIALEIENKTREYFGLPTIKEANIEDTKKLEEEKTE